MTANSERFVAGSRLWLLKVYIRDLELFRDGDRARFDRMVGSGSVSLGSAAKWRAYVVQFASDQLIAQHCLPELTELLPRITALEITIGGA